MQKIIYLFIHLFHFWLRPLGSCPYVYAERVEELVKELVGLAPVLRE